jgi:hypothetical protein
MRQIRENALIQSHLMLMLLLSDARSVNEAKHAELRHFKLVLYLERKGELWIPTDKV